MRRRKKNNQEEKESTVGKERQTDHHLLLKEGISKRKDLVGSGQTHPTMAIGGLLNLNKISKLN